MTAVTGDLISTVGFSSYKPKNLLLPLETPRIPQENKYCYGCESNRAAYVMTVSGCSSERDRVAMTSFSFHK